MSTLLSGGAVNFVGISETLDLSSSVSTAALAADNVLCVVYFATLYYFAKEIGPESSKAKNIKNDEESQLSRIQGIDVRSD